MIFRRRDDFASREIHLASGSENNEARGSEYAVFTDKRWVV